MVLKASESDVRALNVYKKLASQSAVLTGFNNSWTSEPPLIVQLIRARLIRLIDMLLHFLRLVSMSIGPSFPAEE